MCGIAGFAAPPGTFSPTARVLDAMCRAIALRGPDDQGTWLRDGVGLGVRRLSIIDVEGGHQPICNEDETAWMVFNGEIYNHPQLRDELIARGHHFRTRSDTEAVVHAYEVWGERCVDHLNGMFAFALWDRKARTLFLARDRVGIKPLYYRVQRGRLTFASELKALLCDPELRPEVDFAALDEFLALEYVPSPRSILTGVSKLPPGQTLTWRSDGRVTLKQYWDVDLAASERPAPPKSREAHAAELRAALKEAVRKELISDVPLGVFLSGGIDSSAVAAMMAELTPGNVNSFSIGFTDPSFDESRYARQVARHLGTNHQELILEPRMLPELVPTVAAAMDEPFADASILPTYLLSQFARRRVKVALGGDGGDELFAGYPTLQAHRLAGYYARLPRGLRDGLVAPAVRRLPVSFDNLSFDFRAKRFVEGAGLSLGERHVRWLGSFSAAERERLLTPDVREALGRRSEPDLVHTTLERCGARDPLNRVLYLDMKLYLEGDILTKLDRASMMASLEARVPLLNRDFVEHVTALPLSLKLHGLRRKYLLRNALHGLLPDEILERKKKGFGIPVARWLRGPLREPLLAALAPERIQREGFFHYPMIRQLLEEHFSGQRDHRKPLWTLLVFQEWFEAYMTRRARAREAAAG